MDSIKILVCCHKKTEFPDDNIYLPIQVGKKQSKVDLGIQTDCQINDEVCDSISEKNNIFCEMTAMYWAWKNIDKIYPDIDYIGLCHYRRYFNANWNLLNRIRILVDKIIHTIIVLKNKYYGIESMTRIASISCGEMKVNSKKLSDFIIKHDVVATYPFQLTNGNIEEFFQRIGKRYIELLTEIIDADFRKYSAFYHTQLESNKLYDKNMIVLKRELLDEYCTFVFDALNKHIELSVKKNICMDPMNELSYDRVSGYLSELLTSTFVRYAMKKYRVGLTGKYLIE